MGVASINYTRVHTMATSSSIFNEFPSLPSPGAVTVCENNGRFVYATEDDETVNRDMQVTAIFSHTSQITVSTIISEGSIDRVHVTSQIPCTRSIVQPNSAPFPCITIIT